jgi:hypothetical protein
VHASLAVALALGAASGEVDAGTARLLTGIIATAIDATEGIDVLTNDDVKRSLEAEASRQSLGCSTSSCLAELAGAMGAQYAVYGDVGRLGDLYAVTLNVFDSAKASATGRSVITAVSIEELAQKTEATAKQLAQGVPKGSRVLVFDLNLQAASGSSSPQDGGAQGGISPLVLGGGGAVAVGVLALGAGAIADFMSVSTDAQADDLSVPAGKADELYGASDGWALFAAVGYAVGVVGVAGGVALIALGVLE